MRPTCAEGALLRCRVFRLPKLGSTEAEYEDASACPGGDESPYEGRTLAVADGASESMLAGQWAAMLVDAIAALGGRSLADSTVLAEVITRTAGAWPRVVEQYRKGREQAGRPLAWYEEPKLELGAHATVLGLSFHPASAQEPMPSGGGRWSLAALGDSCVFHTRGGKIISADPLDHADDFGVTPHLATTLHPDPELLAQRIVAREGGSWLPGDVFYLATDAAAHWTLTAGGPPFLPKEMEGFFADDGVRFADRQRAQGRLRNDDTTIVRCELVRT
ncbi:hypothetical protein KGA66_28350 [Actinocrinis puniceicyclus]|uniref:Protein phosphatase 2C n=1 Tax=Actinocrinis puniceicyclus TaxID=977794 RepID=A0A8J7WSV6_9ACTN|nr:hypothetical protein [Actinocrinis puniceicyclus]MBS2966978.1 hypothetical protein [Actinocrinis puniceicyclus]